MEYQRSYSVSSSSSSSSSSNYLQTCLKPLSSQNSLASIPSLNSQSHHQNPSSIHCLATLRGHNTSSSSSYISSLAISGKFLYTGSSNREITSWNRTLLLSSNSHSQNPIFTNIAASGNGAVKSIVVLHSDDDDDDKIFFSAHQDHKIRVWKINNHHKKYTCLATLPTLGDRACKMFIPKNHIQIRRHKKRTWVHHVDTVSALALSKDQNFLYSVSWDRTIKIWRTKKDFACLESISNAHDDAINAIAVSHDGYVYTGSADKRIKVWKKREGEKKHALVDTLEKHNSGINALALRNDGCVLLLYSGACDRSILVWEKEEEEGKMVVVGALRGHTMSILCLDVVSDLVCSGSADKTIRIWRGIKREYSCLAVLEGHKAAVKCVTAAVEEEEEGCFVVYSGSLDCDIKMWQIVVPAAVVLLDS